VVLDISLSLSNPLSFLLFSWLFIDRFVFLLFQRVRLDWPVLAPGFLKECGMRELRCYPSNMFLSDEILNFSFLQVFSSPMEQILERLRAFGEFEIIIFGDKVILDDPIEMYVMRTQLAKL
jgi:hypothetical protein